MSVRLYIGNLPEDITRQDLETVFSEGGDESASAKLITDRKTGKCRGFGFVTVKTDEEADQFIEKFNGVTVKETVLKIEKALPRAKEGEGDAPAAPVSNNIPAPISAANRTQSSGGSGNKGGGGNRGGGNKGGGNKGGGNKDGGGGNRSGGGGASTDNGAFQPDPRWASVLEQLKEQLSAQAVE
ncbi:MAG: RNA-binding protein [Cyanobacteria bacterium]|nr:RNA-binding protein [Cyanobacteriota bacterium]